MLAYLLTAWITFAFAMLQEYLDLASESQEDEAALYFHWKLRPGRSPRSLESLGKFCRHCISTLSDLQFIAGLAIVVAGWWQYRTISYYHAQYVMNYWWLTLNSFWTSRVRYLDPTEAQEIGKYQINIRKCIVLLGLIAAVPFVSLQIVRTQTGWDECEGQRCYFSCDQTSFKQTWFWLVGVVLYGIAVGLSFNVRTAQWVNNLGSFVDTFVNERKSKAGNSSRTYQKCFHMAVWWLSGTFKQFLAVWAYGDGDGIIITVFYLFYLSWNTLDITDLRIRNLSLVDGSETSWGFGQWLPLVMLLATLMSVHDNWRQDRWIKTL